MSSVRFTLLILLVACSGCHGQFLSTAAPGTNLYLACPEGTEINVLSVYDSLMGLETDASAYCKSIPQKNCLNSHLLPWMKAVCNKMEDCRLPEPHKKMFTCNYDANKSTLSAIYSCEAEIPGTIEVFVCDGKTVSLKCEKGVIRIIKANYGRLDTYTCSEEPSPMTFCIAPQFTDMVKKHFNCEGKDSCSFPVNPSNMPNPEKCDDKPKYAFISYYCEA